MKRRAFLLAVAAASVAPAFAQGRAMKIGVIGSGRIGSTIGALWAKAGHEVMFSDRDAEQVKRAIDALEPGLKARARAGSVAEAAAFGVADAKLGQAVHLVVRGSGDEEGLRAALRRDLPNFMQPRDIRRLEAMPLNPNGKIDREALRKEWA